MTPLDFIFSLALTLVFEGAAALVWGLRRRDLLLLVLINILTNPLFPGWAVTVVLETGVVLVEGALYGRLGHAVSRPWLFALCANGFSFCMGLAADLVI